MARKGRTLNYVTKYYTDYIFKRLNKKYGLTYPQISKVLSRYHDLAREDLAMGDVMFFKAGLGNLMLNKFLPKVELGEDGKIKKNNLMVNYHATRQLWDKHPELKHKKYVRFLNEHSEGYVYSLYFQASKATNKFKSIYNFKFNATLKKKLSQNIIKGKVEAFSSYFDKNG